MRGVSEGGGGDVNDIMFYILSSMHFFLMMPGIIDQQPCQLLLTSNHASYY